MPRQIYRPSKGQSRVYRATSSGIRTRVKHFIKHVFFSYHRLGERSGQCEEKGHQPPALVNGGVHHVPRMHCVGVDAIRREAAVELVAEEDVTEFGPIVSQHGPVVLLCR